MLTYRDLVHEWEPEPREKDRVPGIVDETIRDGLQTPFAPPLSLREKVECLGFMRRCGVSDVIVGMSSATEAPDALSGLLDATRSPGSPAPWILSRVDEGDIRALIVRYSKAFPEAGINLFINLGALRCHVEGWTLDGQLASLIEALGRLTDHFGRFRVAFEDATRTDPETIRRAIDSMSAFPLERLAIADTAGVATPNAAAAIVDFIRGLLAEQGSSAQIEWHGHNDRGLAVASSLAAIDAGAAFVHGTMLGIGERNGNAALDQILHNLGVQNPSICDWTALADYHAFIDQRFRMLVPNAYPFLGPHSLATSTGTHSAAVAKAIDMGRHDLARVMFSPRSPASSAAEPIFLVSHLSGRRGVAAALRGRGLPTHASAVDAVIAFARRQNRTLTDAELALHATPEASSALAPAADA